MADNTLSSQQQAELAFWTDLVQRVGPEYYYAYRCAEYYDKTRHFPSFLAQEGLGLDFGCGCISVFELSSKHVQATDPLWNSYRRLLTQEIKPRLTYFPWGQDSLSGMFSKGDYAWIACLNMIDHTPDPIFTLSSIWDMLAPRGRLYFEVNFEAGIAPPHYAVWNEKVVNSVLFKLASMDKPFSVHYRLVEDVPEHNQRRYWAELVKI